MTEIIKTLVKGKPVKDDNSKILYLKGFILGSKENDIGACDDYDFEQVEELEVYISEEMREIAKLKEVIRLQEEAIEKLSKPKKQRKGYRHLSLEEVMEIEAIFKKDPFIKESLVVNTYATSHSVVNRIKNGVHPKSSPREIK